MDEEGIELVLARATELRLNISNCIHRASSDEAIQQQKQHLEEEEEEEEEEQEEVKESEKEDEETERLLNICDALEALESQLSSLQAMQQNQKYERETALVEIENSRRALLGKLTEYKGKDLEVIQEATVFASETVEESSDLVLPPYPTRPPLSLENGFPSNSSPTLKSSLQNGVHNLANKNQPDPGKSPGGLGHTLATVAKTVVTVVGVVVILGFAGFGNKRKGLQISPVGAMNTLLRPLRRGGEPGNPCPPGKVLVVEDGQARCLVKERIEVPFESAVSTPDVNYGCG